MKKNETKINHIMERALNNIKVTPYEKYLNLVSVENRKKVDNGYIHRIKNNRFLVRMRQFVFEITFVPTQVHLLPKKIEDLQPKEINFEPLILMADPPWNHLGNNPTRGPIITYNIQSFKKIQNDIMRFRPKIFIGIWVVNTFLKRTLNLLEEMGFKVIANLEDINIRDQKIGGDFMIHKSLGYYFQHSKNTLLLGIRKDLNLWEVTKEKIEQEEDKNFITDTFYSRLSNIPNEKYHMINHILKESLKKDIKGVDDMNNYVELYARSNNIMPGWTYVGDELRKQTSITGIGRL